MESLEVIRTKMLEIVPGARLEIIANASPANQPSLLVDSEHAFAVALFLRDCPGLLLDFASNVTGIDWPEKIVKEAPPVAKLAVAGQPAPPPPPPPVETKTGNYLEAVYHLYSMALKQGPVILRLRTGNRSDKNHLPSLTPIWRSCEFQEREIFDLYGIIFDGHSDLRRLLMWDDFKDHPMRKDYSEPDDYEYEPTPHDDICDKARAHYAGEVKP